MSLRRFLELGTRRLGLLCCSCLFICLVFQNYKNQVFYLIYCLCECISVERLLELCSFWSKNVINQAFWLISMAMILCYVISVSMACGEPKIWVQYCKFCKCCDGFLTFKTIYYGGMVAKTQIYPHLFMLLQPSLKIAWYKRTLN